VQIAIFGASRGVGRAAVDAALAAGHTVTALARNTSSLEGTAATVVAGDVLDAATTGRVLDGANAVLVALGVSPGQRATTPEDVCSRGTNTILAEMRSRGIDRIAIVTSYGVGETKKLTPFPFSVIAKTLLKGIMADKELQEEAVRRSGTRWTIVQPLGLTDGPATGNALASTDGSRGSNQVSRADVAATCIDILARDRFIGESVAVSAKR